MNNLNRIIQLVGVPSSGKSYLLRKCIDNKLFDDVNVIEFGQELKNLLSSENVASTKIASDTMVMRLLTDIIMNRQSAIFSSHLIFYDGSKFYNDIDLDLYTRSIGYMHIYSRPEDIYNRRIKDNTLNGRKRALQSIELIAEHQEKSITYTKDIAERIGAKFLVLKNGIDDKNDILKNIKNFVELVLKNESSNYTEIYFDKWANDYQNKLGIHPLYIHWTFNEIDKRMDGNVQSHILDLGVGNGRLIGYLNNSQRRFIGADISKEQLDLASRSLGNSVDVKFIKTDKDAKVDADAASLDYVVSNATFHHIENKRALLENIHRMLKINGKLIFFDLCFDKTTPEYVGFSIEMQYSNPKFAKDFKESIEQEHLLMPQYLRRTHPIDIIISPYEYMKLLRQVGFSHIEFIPTPDIRYFGFEARK